MCGRCASLPGYQPCPEEDGVTVSPYIEGMCYTGQHLNETSNHSECFGGIAGWHPVHSFVGEFKHGAKHETTLD